MEKAPKKDGDAAQLALSRQKLLEMHNNEMRRKKALARQQAVNGDLGPLAALSEHGERGSTATSKAILRRKEEEFALQSSAGAVLLGSDRLYRRYWLLDLPPEPTFPIGLGVAIEEPPRDGHRQKWSFCMTSQSIGRLLRYLNRSGAREKALASQLEHWMPLICYRLSLVRSGVRTFCDEALASSSSGRLSLPWGLPEPLPEPMRAQDCQLLLAPLQEKLSVLERGLDWLATTSALPDGKKWRRDWIRRLKESSTLGQLSSLSVSLADMLTESHGLLEEWWTPVQARWLEAVGRETVTLGLLALLLMVLDENILLDCEHYPACGVCERSTAAEDEMVKCKGCSELVHTFCASVLPNHETDVWECSQCSEKARASSRKAPPNGKAKSSRKASLNGKEMAPRKRKSLPREEEASPRGNGVRSSTRTRKPTERVASMAAERQGRKEKALPKRRARRRRGDTSPSPSPSTTPSRSRPSSRGAEAMDESNDACEVCDDGGNLLCCETCPRVYHLRCVGLRRQPKGEWHCVVCSNKK